MAQDEFNFIGTGQAFNDPGIIHEPPGRANGNRHARSRARSAAATLIREMEDRRESFWKVVGEPYMRREITRRTVRDLVRLGLEEARGNYRIVTRMFNMPPEDYKRFLNFLRNHQCQLPYRDYR